MSLQPFIPGLFAAPHEVQDVGAPRPATEKQILYAQSLAERAGTPLPAGLAGDRAALSSWIDAHKVKTPMSRFGNYPSSKQVAFAERIARIKRREVPRACFQDKTLMSKWIDGNRLR